MVRIRVAGREAVVQNYEWRSESDTIERWLEAHKNPLGPSPSDPDPDRTLAEQAVRELGAVILEADEPDAVEGTVY